MRNEDREPTTPELVRSIDDIERDIEACLDRDDRKGAMEAAVRGYGPSVLGFLVNVLGNHEDASDVFSEVCLSVWSHLGTFRRGATFRTWIFRIARNAYQSFAAHPGRRRQRPLSDAPEVANIEAQVRTRTLPYLRTDVKDKIAALRERLRPDDRALLVLRVERAMAWDDIARVMMEAEEEPTEEAIKKRATSLRKSFQAIKERLRKMAEQEGLLDES